MNTLKIFAFNFFEQLCDSIINLFKNLFEIFSLIIVFAIAAGIVCVPVLLIYEVALSIINLLSNKKIESLKYMHFVSIISIIITILIFIFVL